jgi:hypothetical protein
MADASMKELMVRLHATLSSVDKVDPALMGLVRELDADIHRLLKSEPAEPPAQSLVDRAAELETRFATDHPRAEQVLREIVEALGRMGV